MRQDKSLGGTKREPSPEVDVPHKKLGSSCMISTSTLYQIFTSRIK